jgi:hypothetical protein
MAAFVVVAPTAMSSKAPAKPAKPSGMPRGLTITSASRHMSTMTAAISLTNPAI